MPHWEAIVRPMRLAVAALAAAPMAALPVAAGAAERPYAFVQGASTLPESGLELESWFGEAKPRTGPASWDWWLGPVAGVTDRIEVGLFAILGQDGAAQRAPEALALESLRLQLSWALADRGAWPVDVRLRLEASQGVGPERSSVWLWAIAARDLGRFNATANLAGWLELEDPVERYLDWLAGVSYELARGVRLGAELHGSTELGKESTVFAGPALALGRGRVWVSSAMGFGLGAHGPSHHGRIVIGLAL